MMMMTMMMMMMTMMVMTMVVVMVMMLIMMTMMMTMMMKAIANAKRDADGPASSGGTRDVKKRLQYEFDFPEYVQIELDYGCDFVFFAQFQTDFRASLAVELDVRTLQYIIDGIINSDDTGKKFKRKGSQPPFTHAVVRYSEARNAGFVLYSDLDGQMHRKWTRKLSDDVEEAQSQVDELYEWLEREHPDDVQAQDDEEPSEQIEQAVEESQHQA